MYSGKCSFPFCITATEIAWGCSEWFSGIGFFNCILFIFCMNYAQIMVIFMSLTFVLLYVFILYTYTVVQLENVNYFCTDWLCLFLKFFFLWRAFDFVWWENQQCCFYRNDLIINHRIPQVYQAVFICKLCHCESWIQGKGNTAVLKVHMCSPVHTHHMLNKANSSVSDILWQNTDRGKVKPVFMTMFPCRLLSTLWTPLLTHSLTLSPSLIQSGLHYTVLRLPY